MYPVGMRLLGVCCVSIFMSYLDMSEVAVKVRLSVAICSTSIRPVVQYCIGL